MGDKKLEILQRQLLKELDRFEITFAAQSPPIKTIASWQETKSKLKSGIQQIIDAAQPPQLLYKHSLPVILIATPEIVYLPKNMGSLADVVTTGDGGGLADISAALVSELDLLGVNVHVTLPEYQNLFQELAHITNKEYETLRGSIQDQNRIYPITDDIFKIAQKVYDDKSAGLENINLMRANAFMRGIISRLFPLLKAQYKHILVHCNDWMTGLIPAAAKSVRIRSLMTFHNVFTWHQSPSSLRANSIDIGDFWRHLIIGDKPGTSYKSFSQILASDKRVDLMNSGLHAADFINTVSRTFLKEMVEGYFKEHNIMSNLMRQIIIRRNQEERAVGIRNAPPAISDPRNDPALVKKYWIEKNAKEGWVALKEGKEANKAVFQKEMNLEPDPLAPLFYWPSRIARPQKGFELLLTVIPELMKHYQADRLQVAVAANGEQDLIARIRKFQEDFPGRISYRPFDREVSQRGMAGCDFVLMPSLYEPCGTPQVVGQLYGSPPVVRKTGGLADSVEHLSHNGIDGSGFVFEEYNAEGLLYGIDEAVGFYRRDPEFKIRVLSRIAGEAVQKFSIRETAKKYIDVYEEIFRRSGHPVKVVS